MTPAWKVAPNKEELNAAAEELVRYSATLALPQGCPAIELACLELLESYDTALLALAKQKARLFDYERSVSSENGYIDREERKTVSMERANELLWRHIEQFDHLLAEQNAIFGRIADALESK